MAIVHLPLAPDDVRSDLTAETAARISADAAIIASGAAPANVGIAPVIATGSTEVRTVADRFADVVNVLDFGAVGDGTTDDSAALQAALDSGAKNVIFAPLSYKVITALAVSTSGQRIVGYGATLVVDGALVSAFKVGFDGAAFAKTDNVIIEGLTIKGDADGVGSSSPPAAIEVYGSTANPHTEGAGCSGLTVRDCDASGFCFGVAATGADRLTVTGCRFGGNFYYPSLQAGGYGVLAQTCWKVNVSGNFFTASPAATDRHAIYVSRDPSHALGDDNVCAEVVISGNFFDWTAVADTGTTDNESPVIVRSARDVTVTGNVFVGGFGGFEYTAENGNGKNVVVSGNTFRDQIFGAYQKGAIAFNRFSATYMTSNVSIVGNTVGAFATSGSDSSAIRLNGIDGLTVEGNTLISGGYAVIFFTGDVSDAYIGGNSLKKTVGTSYVLYFDGTGHEDITIGPNHVDKGGGTWEGYADPVTNLVHAFPRSATVEANSTASPVVRHDPWEIVAFDGVSSIAEGINVIFSGVCSGTDFEASVSLTSLSSNVGQVYSRSQTNALTTGMQIGVLDVATPLGNLAAASHNYIIGITLGS